LNLNQIILEIVTITAGIVQMMCFQIGEKMKDEKPPTVAWKYSYRYEYDNEGFAHVGLKHQEPKEEFKTGLGDKVFVKEKTPLIRREDAEKYYFEKFSQLFVEILTDELDVQKNKWVREVLNNLKETIRPRFKQKLQKDGDSD